MKLSLSSLAIVGIAVFLPSATGHLRPIPQASLSVEDEADHYQVSPASNLAQLRGTEAPDSRMLKKKKKKNKKKNNNKKKKNKKKKNKSRLPWAPKSDKKSKSSATTTTTTGTTSGTTTQATTQGTTTQGTTPVTTSASTTPQATTQATTQGTTTQATTTQGTTPVTTSASTTPQATTQATTQGTTTQGTTPVTTSASTTPQATTQPTSGFCPVTSGTSELYCEQFVSGQTPSATVQQAWDTFQASLTGTYNQVTISGTEDSTGVTCSDPVAVNQLAIALNTNAAVSVQCNGRTWSIIGCGTAGSLPLPPELSVGGACQCSNPGYSVRPKIGSSGNWGGAGTATCGAGDQTIRVEFS